MAAEQSIFSHIGRVNLETDLWQISLKQTNEFVTNTRGQRLHLRSSWPTSIPCKAVVVLCHGYASHINRPHFKFISKQFSGHGIALIAFDFHGHGFSNGTRALVNHPDDLLDDLFSVLRVIYSESVHFVVNSDTFFVQKMAKSVPFFLMGQSMGGATCLRASHILQKAKERELSPSQLLLPAGNSLGVNMYPVELLSDLFAGCVTICPPIVVNMPHPLLRFLVEYTVVPFMGEEVIPEYLSPSGNDEDFFIDASYIEYVKRDRFPDHEDGLSWGSNYRYKTALSMLDLASATRSIIPEINFPFLVLHDPDDKVCLIPGTRELIANSATPLKDKLLASIADGRHDILINKLTIAMEVISDWCAHRITVFTKVNIT
jgi:alpha-beta hydrolase superfamily lysophospholipase